MSEAGPFLCSLFLPPALRPHPAAPPQVAHGTHIGPPWGSILVGILGDLPNSCFFLIPTAPIFKTLILGIIYHPNYFMFV